MTRTVGVGFLGAGPVTQAIHLPTLARVADRFHVECVMDVDEAVAASVAGRVGARWTTDADAVIADDRVEVVVVCSPNAFHADQVIAAFRAGKAAVLCEKPLAMSAPDATRIGAASAETGVPLVVGAMHTFDPGWLAARRAWEAAGEEAHTIRSVIVLPPNPRFEDLASDIVSRPAPRTLDRSDPEAVARTVEGLIMGLAIHDLPLVRGLCGTGDPSTSPSTGDVRVRSSLVPHPSGYLIDLASGGRNVQLFGVNTRNWRPVWTLEAVADGTAMRVAFPPSYVHAGSASGVVRSRGGTSMFGPDPVDGYEAEWRYLADLVSGEAEPLDADVLVRDVTFAIDIARQASALAREGVTEVVR